MFIVIDGIDGSGKGTLTKRLVKKLGAEYIDFPQYGKQSAYFVEKYLRGEYGLKVNAKAASLFFALDRFDGAKQIRTWLSEGKTVIANRYVSSNKGHQLGKLSDNERSTFLSWINELEYGTLGLPIPDMTIFLHQDALLAQEFVDQKAAREYVGGKKRDLHEADLDHLKRAEAAYLFCLEHDSVEKWTRIACFNAHGALSLDEIERELVSVVEDRVKK